MKWDLDAQNELNSFVKKVSAEREPQQEESPPKQSFAERMKELRASMNARANQVFEKVWRDGEKYQELLDVLGWFNLYFPEGFPGKGAVNGALIYQQRPDSKLLMTFQECSDYNLKIKKGAKGIDLFLPVEGKPKDGKTPVYYNPAKLFDISQTTAKETPPRPKQREPKEIIQGIAEIEKFSITLSDQLPDGSDAVYIPKINEVWVRDGQDFQTMSLSLLVEFSHYQLARAKGYERNGESSFIAASSGYMLARHFGLDASSIEFRKEAFPEAVQSPSQVKGILSAAVQTGRQVARQVERGIELAREANREQAGRET